MNFQLEFYDIEETQPIQPTRGFDRSVMVNLRDQNGRSWIEKGRAIFTGSRLVSFRVHINDHEVTIDHPQDEKKLIKITHWAYWPVSHHPDWKSAPGWANYWAVDSGGDAYWWEMKPVYANGEWANYEGSNQFDQTIIGVSPCILPKSN